MVLFHRYVFKAVADIANGLDVYRRLGMPLDLIPQRVDAPVHTARSHENIVAPDLLQNFVACQGAVLPCYRRITSISVNNPILRQKHFVSQFDIISI